MPGAGTIITIDTKPCVPVTPVLSSWLTSIGEDPHRFNKVTWRAGASQWSEAVFLMNKADADTIRGDRANPVEIKMTDLSHDQGSITMDKMFQIKHRPVHMRSEGGNIVDALYEVTLVDERYFWRGKFTSGNSTNVTVPEDRSVYFDSPKDDQTWGQLVTTLLVALGAENDTTVALASGADKPNDFVMDHEQAGVMLDRVCATEGVVFVAAWNPNVGGLGKRYRIATPQSFNDDATELELDSQPLRDLFAGGTVYNPADSNGKAWLNATMPSSVTVLFPRTATDENDEEDNANAPTINQFAAFTSTVGKPSGVSGRDGYTARLYDNLWAIGPIGTEDNAADLQSRADQLATSYYSRFRITNVDALMRGFLNRGLWPGTVQWMMSPDGPFTRYKIDSSWPLYGGTSNVHGGFLDKRVVGVGGITVGKTVDGSLFLSAGSSGTCTTPLDLTYSGEHTEAAILDSGWDRLDQGVNDGVKITLQTGESYYDAGDETLYKYVRDLTFDSVGKLKLIGAETRVTVEVPEECT